MLQLTAAANLATDEATYLQVVRGKTAALFAAATEVGGVIAGAPEAAGAGAPRPTATRSGSPSRSPTTCSTTAGVGAALGKNVGDDFRERKMTLPVIRARGRGGRRRSAPSGRGRSAGASSARATSRRRWG